MDTMIVRIQGLKGGHPPVMEQMQRMVDAGIPFVQINGLRMGSRRCLDDWTKRESGDLLIVRARATDFEMIMLMNTGCAISDYGERWAKWRRPRR